MEHRNGRRRYQVTAEHQDGTFERLDCEGYILITKNQENVVLLHAEGRFDVNKDYVSMLNCIKMMLGEDRFTMCLAALEAQNCITYMSGEIVKEGVGC